jgi:hypothetical protein
LFDLNRANFRAASTIFLTAVGTEMDQHLDPWLVDSEVVFCVRMLESYPGDFTVVTERSGSANYRFLPPPRSSSGMSVKGRERRGSLESAASMVSLASSQYDESFVEYTRWQRLKRWACKRRKRANRGVQGAQYFLEPRYASGQLFIGNVVTSLVVNEYFFPSLSQLVESLVSAHVTLEQVPDNWVGETFKEFLLHLWRDDFKLAIGILRFNGAPGKKSRWSYVYCSPNGEDCAMKEGDRVICLGISHLLSVEDFGELGREAMKHSIISRSRSTLRSSSRRSVG